MDNRIFAGFRSAARLLAAGVLGGAVACGSDPEPSEPDPVGVGSRPDASIGPEGGPLSDAGTPGVGASAESAVCSAAEWCFRGPQLHSNTLFALWVRGASDLWAVGEAGTVIHFEEGVWTAHPPPTSAALRAIWSDGTDTWVVGDESTVLHGRDGEWQVEVVAGLDESAALRGVWGDAAGNLWVVGADGVLFERREGAWAPAKIEVTANLNAVWARGSQAWAVGDDGTVLWLSEGQWQALGGNTGRDLFAVAGNESELWIAGAGGEVRRWDAEAERFVAAEGEESRPESAVRALSVLPDGRVLAAGDSGDVYRFDPSLTCLVEADAGAPPEPCPGWVSPRATGDASSLHAVWATGQDIWAVGDGGLTVRFQDELRTVLVPSGRDNFLSVTGTESGATWVAGDRLLAGEAGDWRPVVRDSVRALYAAHALSDGVLVAGTGGEARAYRGEQWQSLDVEPNVWLHGLWSDGSTGWLVGARGRAYGLLNETVWTELETPTSQDLLAVTSAGGTAWAVGEGGVILRHDGARWAEIPADPDAPRDADLRAVWAGADGHVWVVGTGATALHFDGVLWRETIEQGSYSLNGVWGRASDDVWAVGSGGLILHHDGESWAPQPSGTSHCLNAVWGRGDRVYVAGERSTILVKQLD